MSSTLLLKNSLWGTVSSIAQNLLYSIFFIIVARHYDTNEFGNYILANTLYGMILSFSSLGLGQWFMRNMGGTEDKEILTNKFIQIQIQSGIGFYLLLIIASIALYGLNLPSQLAMIIGLNVIFDNIIYAVKCINIVAFEQQRTFVILFAEALIKVMIGISLLFYHFQIMQLVLLVVLLRFATLNIFIKNAAGGGIKIWSLFLKSYDIGYWKKVVFGNWAFVIIGSIAVLFWSAGNILASKFLPLEQVGYYEISFKLFAMAEIIPLMVTTSIFPILSANVIAAGNSMPGIFKTSMQILNSYGVLAYLFVYSYSSKIIPVLFGAKFEHTSLYTTGMFLTMLIFPMSILQANVLVANKKEKIDMWLNVISLITYLAISFTGLYMYKDLSVVNYAIFISFLLFNLLQTIVIHKLGWQNYRETIHAYALILFPVVLFHGMEYFIDKTMLFPSLLLVYFTISIVLLRNAKSFNILKTSISSHD